MKAVVTMLVTGKFSVQVDVNDAQQGDPDMDDLKTKALNAFDDADFGPLYDIDMEYKRYETDAESFVSRPFDLTE